MDRAEIVAALSALGAALDSRGLRGEMYHDRVVAPRAERPAMPKETGEIEFLATFWRLRTLDWAF
jgi:hypothetical protein